jgi:hypothetical protein
VAKTVKAKRRPKIDRSLDDAAMAEVARVEALAQRTTRANPYCANADETEETIWREVAHASRQLRPEALTKADDPHSEFSKYKRGFRFRLLEATATIAEAVEYERVHRFNQRRRAGEDRPRTVSPFTQFITGHLKRNPGASAKEIEAALVYDAREGRTGKFELSGDETTILAIGDRVRSQKISGIPAAVAKAKKKISSR